MDKLLIVDGNSILNRGFYGVSGSNLMKNKDGIFTNAIYGFLAILQKVINEEQPGYICVSFDLKAPTFRHKMYDGYKATRKGMPEELAVQMPYMKDILKAMNICILEQEGYEADDIIGTVAKKMKDKMKVLILTGDRDSFQLVEDNINIRLPHTVKGQTTVEIINPEVIKEKYGLEPLQMIELKALMGDSSDNIPGIPGVGEKTALTLVQTYKSVEQLYEFVENNPEQKDVKGKLLEKIIENKELAFLSKDLGTIMIDVPITFTTEMLKIEDFNYEELYKVFKYLELKSFIQKYDLESHVSGTNESSVDGVKLDDVKLVNMDSEEHVIEMIEEIKNKKEFTYFFLDKDRYDFEDIKMFTFYVNNTVYNVSNTILKKDIFIKNILPLFEEECILKIGYDIKKDMLMLENLEREYGLNAFDTVIGAYLLDSTKTKYTLENLLDAYLDLRIKQNENKQTQISFDLGFENNQEDNEEEENELENRKIICYGIYKLKEIFEKKLQDTNMLDLFNNIEMKLMRVLADMEFQGIQTDINVLNELGNEIENNVLKLEQEIYDLSGELFNIDSPKQLGEVLFEKMKLPIVKKNKTGYSTDVEVLEKLAEEHPVVEKIIEYRQYQKLRTTYIEGIKPFIVDGRIHSKLNQTSTATGRLSSTEPNLQNIPVRTEYGKNLRKIFVAKPGCILLDADYSQIELRVLAHIANDPVMIKSFNDDEDIHTTTAMQVFDLKREQVTQVERRAAKAVNFGIVYGISDFGLSKEINKSVRESKAYINKYLEKYSGIKTYMENIVEDAKENGFVKTMFNRRRYIPEVKSSNFNIRQFGERVAMNTPIQGTAADIIKIAMINVYEKLKNKEMKSKLILQIHDELIIETYEDEIEVVKEILKNEMENATQLEVPLRVEVEQGKSWYDTK